MRLKTLLLSLLVILAATAKAEIASGTSGTATWTIDDDGMLTIGHDATVDEGVLNLGTEYAPWYAYHEQIKHVKFEGSVTAASCRFMFYGCENLQDIDFTGFRTDGVEDMMSMFSGCSSLEYIDLSAFNTESVKYMASMFDGCSSLSSLDLSYLYAKNVIDMSGMLSGCSSLSYIYFGEFNTENVENMQRLFSGCSSLTNIELGSFNTQKVKHMDYMFQNCSALHSLDLSYFNTQSLLGTGYMFDGCSSLMTLNLTNFSTAMVEEIMDYDMFKGCYNLRFIICESAAPPALAEGTFFTLPTKAKCQLMVPEGAKDAYRTATGWSDLNLGIAYGAIGSCVWSIDHDGVFTLEPEDGVAGEYGSTDTGEWPWNAYAEQITSVVVKNEVYASTCANLFNGCKNMTSADLSGLRTLNAYDMSGMFSGCSSLSYLKLSNFTVYADTEIKEMFLGCDNLLRIETTDLQPSSLVEGTFASLPTKDDCLLVVPEGTKEFYAQVPGWNELGTVIDVTQYPADALALGKTGTCIWYITSEGELVIAPADGVSGDLPEDGWYQKYDEDSNYFTSAPWGEYRDVVYSANIMPRVNAISCSDMFCGMSKIKTIDLRGLITDWAGGMNSMFAYCSSLTSIDLGNLQTHNVQDMQNMFNGCSALTTVDLSNFDVQNVAKMYRMFYKCAALESIDLSSFYVQNVTDMRSMFEDCTALTSVNFSNFNAQEPTDISQMFFNCSSLKSVDFSNANTENVTNMTHMFSGCSALTNLDLTHFNTKNVTKMSSMFDDCSALTSLDLSSFNTKNVTDMNGMFAGCSALISINLNNFNTEKVENMTSMFDGCNHLTSIDVSSFNTKNVTDMSGMFAGCSSLTNIDLSNFDTQNVASMFAMFIGSSALTSLNLSSFNTQNVTAMEHMFQDCMSLTSLDLTNFKTDKVERMHNMFNGCSSLTSLDLSNFNTDSMVETYEMFNGCSSLTSLDLRNFNTQNVTYMDYMFRDCTSLTSLDLSNFNTQNVEDMEDMFTGCDALTTIISNRETPSTLKAGTFETFANRANCTLIVPEGTKALYAAADGWNELGTILDGTEPAGPEIPADAIASGETGTCIWYITSEGELVIAPADGVSGDLPEEGWEENYDDDGNYYVSTPWFAYRDNIKSAKIESGVKAMSCRYMFGGLDVIETIDLSNLDTQNVTEMGRMFSWCSSLTSLDLSNFNTENVTDMEMMFYGCSSLTSLDLSNFNTENVTSMYLMFVDCSSLTSLNLSNFNTQSVTEMAGMFNGCSSLTSLDLSNFNTQNVTEMYSMFDGCSSLTSLDLSNFNTVNVTDMRSMFSHCSSLTSLDLSNFNTENVTSMYLMFADCSSLTSLNLSNFNTENVTDMISMFSVCSSLTSLNLSNFNTQNVTSMFLMFSDCSSLTSLNLSNFNTENVTDMRWMFEGCGSLNTIISDNPTPSTLKEGTFETLPTKETCQLIVPEGSEALYAVADGWKEISKFEEPLFFDETGTAMTVLSNEADIDSLIQYPENIKEVMVECPLSDKNAQTIAALPNVLVVHWKVDMPVPQVIINSMHDNEIIYVPESSQTDGTNIVRGKTASHIVFTDKQPLRITEPFFAESIEFSRNFSRTTIPGSSSGWETLVLPFEVQDIYSTLRKSFLYPFSNRDESGLHFWLAQLANGSFVSAEGIAANVPYIISMPNSDMYEDAYNISGDVKFFSEDVQVQSTLGLDATSAQGYSLVPKYEDFEKKDSYAWYALNEQTYADNPVGSIFVRDTEASPFEAHLVIPASYAQKRISISLSSFFGGATRIDDMLMKGDNDGVIYDLTGRKVKGMNQPGIYIVNGKKVLLK